MILNKEIRNNSWDIVRELGFHSNSKLPLLDEGLKLRSRRQIVGRSLALFTVVASSYGFERSTALQWIERENLGSYLSETEKNFLVDGVGNKFVFQSGVEALNVFAWALGLVEEIKVDSSCDKLLITKFPDIKRSASSLAYQESVVLRSFEELLSTLDLLYCLHWAYIDASLNEKAFHQGVGELVVRERRRALEWMLSDTEWDEITLDT